MKDDKTQGEGNPSLAKKRKLLNIYVFYGHGVIWDRARNKALCKFRDGKLTTTDIRLIAILLKEKFKFKTGHPVAEETLDKVYQTYKKEIGKQKRQSKRLEFDRKKLNSMKISELRILFKAKKIRLLQIMTKQDMINRLLGAKR